MVWRKQYNDYLFIFFYPSCKTAPYTLNSSFLLLKANSWHSLPQYLSLSLFFLHFFLWNKSGVDVNCRFGLFVGNSLHNNFIYLFLTTNSFTIAMYLFNCITWFFTFAHGKTIINSNEIEERKKETSSWHEVERELMMLMATQIWFHLTQ